MKEKIKVAIVGYGNVGKYAVDAIEQEPDMELIGIVEKTEVPECKAKEKYIFVKDISELQGIDVAIVAVPSRLVPEVVIDLLNKRINTVDSFDIHSEILDLQKKLM